MGNCGGFCGRSSEITVQRSTIPLIEDSKEKKAEGASGTKEKKNI